MQDTAAVFVQRDIFVCCREFKGSVRALRVRILYSSEEQLFAIMRGLDKQAIYLIVAN